jgi:4-amino-4-deoxy-L-arabinose transferase-like glycosyltransferase
VLVLICACVYVPGLMSLPAIDRDESRFAQASRQMLASGDYVVPFVGKKPRLNKPPMIYWLQSSSARMLTGGRVEQDAVWMYRIPSLIAGIAAIFLTWRLGRMMFSPRTAWIAALMLGLSPIVWWEARQARADELLLAASVAAVLCQWKLALLHGSARASSRRGDASVTSSATSRWMWVIAVWGCVAFATLTKGPLTLMIVMLGAGARAIWMRSWSPVRELRPVVGILIVMACFAPWVIAVAERVGWGSYLALISDEMFGRAAEAKEGHAGWPLYHTTLAAAIMFPASLMLGLGVARALRICWQARRESSRRSSHRAANLRASPEVFLVCMIVPSWIVFELVSTKLPHYTMPLLPALSLLCARAINDARVHGWLRIRGVATLVWVWMIAVGGFVLAVGAASTWIAWSEFGAGFAAVVAIVAVRACLVASVGVVRHWRQRSLMKMLVCSLASVVPSLLLVGVLLPSTPGWLARDVVRGVSDIDPQGLRAVADVHFREDSVILGTHGRASHVEETDLRAWAADHPNGLVLLDQRRAASFPDVRELRQVTGVNYSNGKRLTVIIGEFTETKGDAP